MEWVKILIESLINGAFRQWDVLVGDSLKAWGEFWNAIPNPFRMLDALLRFFSSFIGRAVAIPASGIAETVITRLQTVKMHNRVIRVDDSLRMFAKGTEEFLQAITTTDESGLVETLLTAVSVRLWRLWKDIKLVRMIVGAEDEIDFVEKVIASYRKKAVLYGIVGLVVGVLGFILIFSLYVSMACWCFVFIKGEEGKFILPQDSKKTWRKKGGMSRSNRRKGPDVNQ